jgi:type I restriction enzyme, S subunit
MFTEMRLDRLATSVREVVEVDSGRDVFLYSIPAFELSRDGALTSGADVGSAKLLLKGGELLISKLNPRKQRIVVAEPHTEPTACSSEFVALRVTGAEPRFIYYALHSEFARQRLHARSRSVTRSQQRVDPTDITKMSIPVPGRAQQRAIAAYLDRETARLDAFIERRVALLDLRRERLERQVADATRAEAIALQDYSVCPAGWRWMHLRRCFRLVRYGIGEAAGDVGDIAVLGMGNVSEGQIVGAPGGRVATVDPLLILREGDLLFNRTNSLALVAKVAYVGCLPEPTTAASYLVILRVSGLAHAKYLNYVLNARPVLGLARSLALPSIGQANLNPTRYGQIKVLIAPYEQQAEIVQRLDEAKRQLDLIQDRASRQLRLLRERRSALITAAVTGRLTLPAVA